MSLVFKKASHTPLMGGGDDSARMPEKHLAYLWCTFYGYIDHEGFSYYVFPGVHVVCHVNHFSRFVKWDVYEPEAFVALLLSHENVNVRPADYVLWFRNNWFVPDWVKRAVESYLLLFRFPQQVCDYTSDLRIGLSKDVVYYPDELGVESPGKLALIDWSKFLLRPSNSFDFGHNVSLEEVSPFVDEEEIRSNYVSKFDWPLLVRRHNRKYALHLSVTEFFSFYCKSISGLYSLKQRVFNWDDPSHINFVCIDKHGFVIRDLNCYYAKISMIYHLPKSNLLPPLLQVYFSDYLGQQAMRLAKAVKFTGDSLSIQLHSNITFGNGYYLNHWFHKSRDFPTAFVYNLVREEHAKSIYSMPIIRGLSFVCN